MLHYLVAGYLFMLPGALAYTYLGCAGREAVGGGMAALSLAFAVWFNESWLYLFENPIWLNRYTGYAIILGFGLWRIRTERNPYTRKRLIILVVGLTYFATFFITPLTGNCFYGRYLCPFGASLGPLNHRNRLALLTTVTDDMAMAAPAIMGLSSSPMNG